MANIHVTVSPERIASQAGIVESLLGKLNDLGSGITATLVNGLDALGALGSGVSLPFGRNGGTVPAIDPSVVPAILMRAARRAGAADRIKVESGKVMHGAPSYACRDYGLGGTWYLNADKDCAWTWKRPVYAQFANRNTTWFTLDGGPYATADGRTILYGSRVDLAVAMAERKGFAITPTKLAELQADMTDAPVAPVAPSLIDAPVGKPLNLGAPVAPTGTSDKDVAARIKARVAAKGKARKR